MSNELATITTDESKQLAALESTIRAGIETFKTVGAALMDIRDDKLYRADYKTFGAYCKVKWGMDRTRAYQLIGSAAAAENVKDFRQNGPSVESHAAPLTRIKDPAEQQQVWATAVDTAPDGKVTAKHVQRTVDEHVTETTRPPVVTGPIGPPCFGMQFARIAIMKLEQIAADDSERIRAFAQVKGWIEDNER